MAKTRGKQIVLQIITLIIALLVALPLVWSFRLAITQTFSTAVPLIPQKITFSNFSRLFSATPFLVWLINTLIFAGAVTGLNLIFAPLAGYVLARQHLPGTNIILFFIISAWVIPWITMLIPLYVFMSKVGLVNTHAGLIIPLAVNPMVVFLTRQYFLNIPEEFEEAALIDGCSKVGAFLKIILPLSKPALMIVAVITFMSTWGNFVVPLIMINSDSKQVLTVGLATLSYGGAIDWGIKASGALFGILPMLALFVALNKYFMQGLAMRTGTEIK